MAALSRAADACAVGARMQPVRAVEARANDVPTSRRSPAPTTTPTRLVSARRKLATPTPPTSLTGSGSSAEERQRPPAQPAATERPTMRSPAPERTPAEQPPAPPQIAPVGARVVPIANAEAVRHFGPAAPSPLPFQPAACPQRELPTPQDMMHACMQLMREHATMLLPTNVQMHGAPMVCDPQWGTPALPPRANETPLPTRRSKRSARRPRTVSTKGGGTPRRCVVTDRRPSARSAGRALQPLSQTDESARVVVGERFPAQEAED